MHEVVHWEVGQDFRIWLFAMFHGHGHDMAWHTSTINSIDYTQNQVSCYLSNTRSRLVSNICTIWYDFTMKLL